MSPELTTTWAEHDSNLQKVLLLATRTLRIFDADLSKMGLEKQENAAFLRRFLSMSPQNTLQIALRNAEPFRRSSPRLFKLLADYPNTMQVLECAPQLASLTDAFVISDEHHAFARIHDDHARARTIIDNTEACRPYLLRFAEILKEGGTPIGATTLGL